MTKLGPRHNPDRLPPGAVMGGGEPDPVQKCRCHTHRPAARGQRLYKLGNYKLTNRDSHLTGCPVLAEALASGQHVITSG